MKYLLLIFIFINAYSCKAQSDMELKKKFIESFVDDNRNDVRYFEDKKLYFFGKGANFDYNGVNVIFLSLEEVKKRLAKKGSFNLISIEETKKNQDTIRTSFKFLKALYGEDSDFAQMDNMNAVYCINISDKKSRAIWCGDE